MAGKRILVLLILSPLLVQSAMAVEHSSELLGKAVNFVVLFGSLAYILHRPLRRFLEARAQRIENALKEAENSRKEAEKRLSEMRERLGRLEEEIARIKREGEEEGRRQKGRIIDKAQKEAERLRHFTEEEIEMLTRAGIRELKEHAAELATALACERIKHRLTPETSSALIDKSIEKIERLYEKAGIGQEIHQGVS